MRATRSLALACLARKKPVEVWFREPDADREEIHTLEGTLLAIRGRDYVICGVRGELYPIEKTIFEETYDVIEAMK